MKDLEKIAYFLDIQFVQNGEVIKMKQKKCIQKMLKRFGMAETKHRTTPSEQKLEYVMDDKNVKNIVKVYAG